MIMAIQATLFDAVTAGFIEPIVVSLKVEFLCTGRKQCRELQYCL